MPSSARYFVVAISLVATFTTMAVPARASFHLMQIEQVVGGWCGDPAQQAIQLRLRAGGQNQVANRVLRFYDASGSNPITAITFPSNVSTSSAGARILVTTSALAAAHGVTADFLLTNPLPTSYLAAGRVTFEDGSGNAIWSLAWGGAGYTGSHAGTFDNDADGNFGPAFASGLPISNDLALRFSGAANAMSTNNAADYALTSGAATLTNNGGAAVVLGSCLFGDGFETGSTAAWSDQVPLTVR